VAKVAKTLDRVLRGTSDANIRFADLCTLLHRLGFEERMRGDHHIFTRDGVEEILNLQPRGSQAKAYQVKQVRSVIVNYGLADDLTVEQSAESDWLDDNDDQMERDDTDER
jgi:hypothetical protein